VERESLLSSIKLGVAMRSVSTLGCKAHRLTAELARCNRLECEEEMRQCVAGYWRVLGVVRFVA
jgi:hypothetical protein